MTANRNVLILIALAIFMVACATGPVSVKSSYVQAEKQWMALAQDYVAWKQTGLVDEDRQEQIEGIFTKASTALDTYKLLVLSGANTDEVVMTLNSLKREILIELAKKGGK